MLSWADWILSVFGALLAALLFTRWALRGFASPWAQAVTRPNKLRDDAVVIPVMAYFSVLLLSTGILGYFGEVKPASVLGLMVGVSAQSAGAIACLMLGQRHFTEGWRGLMFGPGATLPIRMHNGPWGTIIAGTTLLSLTICPLILQLTVTIVQSLVPSFEIPRHATLEMLSKEGQSRLLIAGLWISAAVVAPIAEELFFRGILQNYFFSTTRSRSVAVALSSLLFAAAHTQQLHTIPALIVLAAMLGWAYERTGAIFPCAMIHALFNLKTLIWEAAQPSLG